MSSTFANIIKEPLDEEGKREQYPSGKENYMKENKEIIYEELSEDDKAVYDALEASGFLELVRQEQEKKKRK